MPYVLPSSTLEAGVTLASLLTELYARGYDYLNQDGAGRTRAIRWIDQAHQEICLEELWPFRLTTTTGAAPLTISDVDQVLSVIDTGNSNAELTEMTERELTMFDLAATGTPWWYFRDNLVVRVWPAATAAIEVRYWMLPSALVNDTDTTMIPARYADVIIDGAVRRAAKDRDNAESVALAQQERDRGLALMRRQLLVAPTHMQVDPFSSVDG